MGEGPGDLPYEDLVKKREQEELENQRHQELEDRKKAEQLATIESQGVSFHIILTCKVRTSHGLGTLLSTTTYCSISYVFKYPILLTMLSIK